MAWSRALACVVFVLGMTLANAQENRYMVFFKDKDATPYSVSSPEDFLGEKALLRRSKQNIPVTEQDIPVNSNYIQGVIDEGATFFYSTRWMNGVLVQCDAAIVPDIENLSFVDYVDLVAPGAKPVTGGRRKGSGRKGSTHESTVTATQLGMLGIDDMQAAGFRGEGVTIAVLDVGFPGVDTAEPFQLLVDEGRLNESASYDFVYRQQDIFQHEEHGTEALSTIAAYMPGAFTGGAYKANIQLYVTEDDASEYRIEEYNWLFATERADSAGVDIISSSLGYNTFDLPAMNYDKSDLDGETAVITKAATWAADRGILVVVSAGNEGANSWHIITAPADAQNVLAVGAVNSAGERSPTSSIGPAADGRFKPDVAAMGVGTAVIKANGTTAFLNGTSFSAPLIAALAAGIWQRYPNLTNTELIEAMEQTASQATNPDNLLGYGIPNFVAVSNKLEWQPQQNLVEVYPNPVKDTLNIRPRSPEDITSCNVEIISLQGQVIASKLVSFDWLKRTYITDCEGLPSGMYFLRVWLGSKIFSFKLVKI